MELYGSLIANKGGGGGGGTTDVPIKSISVNGSGVVPVNKNVNIEVPTKVSELDNDNNYIKESDLSLKKSDEVSSDYEASYKLVVKSGTEEEKVIGDIINIPKHYELTNAIMNTCDKVDTPVAGYKVGDKYLDLTLSTGNGGSSEGGGSGESGEIEGSSCCNVTTDIGINGDNNYLISIRLNHNSTHTSNKQVIILTFNKPVTYISSSGSYLSGSGTRRLKIEFAYWMNNTDTVGASLTISCDSYPSIERAVCLCGGAGDILSEDTASNEYNNSDSNTSNEKHIYVLLSDIPTKTSQLINDSSFVTESGLTAKDYADKTYVGEQIAQSEHLKRELVTVLPEPSVADEHTIYMLKDDSVKGSDKFKEYMLIEGVVQCVGDTSVDLTDYVKTADIPTELPANGGNADTVNNHTVESDVPVDAVFTDTVYDDTEVKGSINKLNSNLDRLEFDEVAGGKNLLDFNSRIVDALLNNTTGEVVKNSTSVGYWVSPFIPVKAGEKYAVNNTSNSDMYWYDANYSFIIKSQNVGFNKLTTAPSNAKFLRIDCSDKETIHSNAIIVENDSTIPYEPYIPSVKILAGVVNQQNESLSVIGKCKNLLNPTLQKETEKGVTCTNNGDGTYTLNGTATGYKAFVLTELHSNIGRFAGCKIVGLPSEIDTNNIDLSVSYRYENGDASHGNNLGDIVDNVKDTDKSVKVLLIIRHEQTISNVVVKPMITTNLNATYDDFVPYTGDGKTLAHNVAEIRKDLGDLTLSASGTTLSITDGTHTWTLEANK